jgi:hypothetical protein
MEISFFIQTGLLYINPLCVGYSYSPTTARQTTWGINYTVTNMYIFIIILHIHIMYLYHPIQWALGTIGEDYMGIS